MEHKTVQFPVTPETFPQAWVWLDSCRRKAIVRKYVMKIAGLVGNTLYFLLMCILIYGFLRQQGSGALREFLRQIPLLPRIWDWLLACILRPELGTWGQIGIELGLLYLIPTAGQMISFGIVRLCCRPAAKPEPQGDDRETANTLLQETEKLMIAIKRDHIPSNIVYNLVFLVAVGALLTGYVLVSGVNGNAEAMTGLVQKVSSLWFSLFIVGLWIGYSALNWPLTWVVRLLCRIPLPEDLPEQVQDYAFRCDPEKKARLEEENRILALAEEIKARRKQEREALYR